MPKVFLSGTHHDMVYQTREIFLYLYLNRWKNASGVIKSFCSFLENQTEDDSDLMVVIHETSPGPIPQELKKACANHSEPTLMWIERNKNRLLEGEKNLTPHDAVAYAIKSGERIPELEERIVNGRGGNAFQYCRKFGPLPLLEKKLIEEEEYQDLLWYASKVTHKIFSEDIEKGILAWSSAVWDKTSSIANLLELYMNLHCKEKGRWIEFEKDILKQTPNAGSWQFSMLKSYIVALYDAPGGEANRIEWVEKFFLESGQSVKWAPLIRTYIKVFPDPELIRQLLPLLPNDES